jgi:hypothetical protein
VKLRSQRSSCRDSARLAHPSFRAIETVCALHSPSVRVIETERALHSHSVRVIERVRLAQSQRSSYRERARLAESQCSSYRDSAPCTIPVFQSSGQGAPYTTPPIITTIDSGLWPRVSGYPFVSIFKVEISQLAIWTARTYNMAKWTEGETF